jgi:hypothetical protein
MARRKRTRNGGLESRLEIEVAPSRGGLWLNIRTSHVFQYEIRFFALGTGGHQRSGFLRGNVRVSMLRRFVDLGFDAVVVGITWHRLSFGSARKVTVAGPVLPPGDRLFSPMHPSLTSTEPIRLPTGLRRRRGRAVRPYAETYPVYAAPYALYDDRYGLYAEGYQDMYGAYLETYGQIAPYADQLLRARRKGVARPKRKRRAVQKKRTGKISRATKLKPKPKSKPKTRARSRRSTGSARHKGRVTKRKTRSAGKHT